MHNMNGYGWDFIPVVYKTFVVVELVNIIYTTLAWAFKGVARCLTRILPGAISWESGLPMTLIPSQFKESMRFDSLY